MRGATYSPKASAAKPVVGHGTRVSALASGGFESSQRVLASEPVVENSKSGTRWLGIATGRRSIGSLAEACAHARRTMVAVSRCSSANSRLRSGRCESPRGKKDSLGGLKKLAKALKPAAESTVSSAMSVFAA